MVMCNAPLISVLGDEHGEARRSWHWLAIHYTSKRVEAGDNGGAVVDCCCAPLFNRVRVAASFYGREVFYYRLRPLGDDWTNSSEKDCGRTIGLSNGLWIVGAISG